MCGTVECMVETKIFGFTNMVQIGDLIITPYHPIVYNNKWCFPVDIAPVEQIFIESYYNYVLKDSKSMICENI